MHAHDGSNIEDTVSSGPKPAFLENNQEIHSTSSFEPNYVSNLSRGELDGYNEDKQHEEVCEDPNKANEDDSILGLLREELIPFDTSDGIPFQLSWEDVPL